MRRRRADADYASVPRGRFAWSRLMWLICGTGMVAAMSIGLINVLTGIYLPVYRDFPGELRPARDPVSIALPAGVYLNQILVERGEEVRAGQTVATLDVAAMQARLEEIEHQIFADVTLRSCILGLDAGPEPVSERGSEMFALAEIARQDCAVQQDDRATAQAQVAVLKGILHERRGLFEDYLTLLVRHVPDAPDHADRLRMALSLALSRNILDHQIAAMDDLADDERIRYQQEVIEKSRDLSERIAQNMNQRAVLAQFLQAPRLKSPDNGRVNRIRPVQAGVSLLEAAEVLEITPSDRASFVANFTVPMEMAELMQPGLEVQLTLLGGWHRTPMLQGVVAHAVSGQDGKVMISVDLKPESVEDLTAPTDGVALRGVGTASALRVRLADYNLGQQMQDQLLVLRPNLPETLSKLVFQ